MPQPHTFLFIDLTFIQTLLFLGVTVFEIMCIFPTATLGIFPLPVIHCFVVIHISRFLCAHAIPFSSHTFFTVVLYEIILSYVI